MTPEEIERCWRDPHNWTSGFYHCKADPRIIVPRRLKWMGWTVNAARPGAIPMLLFMLAVLIVPVSILTINPGEALPHFLTVAASVLLVCLISAYLSSTSRFRD